jgi:uncharacterized membrane protein
MQASLWLFLRRRFFFYDFGFFGIRILFVLFVDFFIIAIVFSIFSILFIYISVVFTRRGSLSCNIRNWMSDRTNKSVSSAPSTVPELKTGSC